MKRVMILVVCLAGSGCSYSAGQSEGYVPVNDSPGALVFTVAGSQSIAKHDCLLNNSLGQFLFAFAGIEFVAFDNPGIEQVWNDVLVRPAWSGNLHEAILDLEAGECLGWRVKDPAGTPQWFTVPQLGATNDCYAGSSPEVFSVETCL